MCAAPELGQAALSYLSRKTLSAGIARLVPALKTNIMRKKNGAEGQCGIPVLSKRTGSEGEEVKLSEVNECVRGTLARICSTETKHRTPTTPWMDKPRARRGPGNILDRQFDNQTSFSPRLFVLHFLPNDI